jgi:PAS domain S-box-containing protein
MQAVSIVELKSMQRRMTNILESITDGVVIYDRKWHITFVNQQGAQIVGQTPEELLGKTVWDIHPEAVGSTFYQECQRAIAQQVSVHFQEFYAPLNIWFQIHAYPSEEGLIVLYQDITQRKQIEEALQRACTELEHRVLARTLQLSRTDTLLCSETLARRRAEEARQNTNEQLANIFERITDGFCAVDREWRYTYVNPKAEQILQKNQTELLGKNIWDVFPQAIGSTAYQQYQEALRTGCSVRFESFCPATERWFETSAYPSHDGLSIYFQDITVRKRIEEERQQLLAREQEARIKAELAEQRCHFLAQASEVLASSLDYETTLNSVARLVVPFLADYCLIHRLEVDGQLQMVAAVHHDPSKQKLLNELGCLYQTDIQNSNNLMAQVARTGEAIFAAEIGPHMAQFVTRDSRLLELKTRLQPKSLIVLPLIARRQILGTLMLAMAQSDRHYKESDLWLTLDLARRAAMAIDNAQLYHKAQESNRLKDEFLLTLSHELRTPLNSILGWATILLTRNLNERTLRQALETIERKARAQVQIVYDLLDVSRLMAGRLRLNPGWVELGAIIHEAIANLQLAIEAKSIQLDSHIDSSVGLVRGDPKYLYRVVWNLLSNAIKFTPNGGRVEIQLMQVDNCAQIQVRDTGVGIHPDFLPHVFDRFRQADSTTTRRFGGVGLGLSLVGQLVELHGGTVQALSDGVDKGATFIVKLPLAPVPDRKSVPSEQARVDEGMPSGNVPVLEGLRVLIVDYEADSREAIASRLAEYKAEAIAVASVDEALRVLHHFKPDVVIRSNNILESDAYWLLSRMRTLCMDEGGQIPIIALTTDASEKTVVQARSAGIQMHISEPIGADELAAIVATLVGGNESNENPFS